MVKYLVARIIFVVTSISATTPIYIRKKKNKGSIVHSKPKYGVQHNVSTFSVTFFLFKLNFNKIYSSCKHANIIGNNET